MKTDDIGGKLLTAIAIVVVSATVIWGLIMTGSPEQQREKKFDVKRISDLQEIAGSIDLYYTRHNTLPDNLDTLDKEPGITINRNDPKTGIPYSYTVTSGKNYTLSAEFSTESDNGINNIWEHSAGKQLFQLSAKTLEQR
jgi:hypothetical protein